MRRDLPRLPAPAGLLALLALAALAGCVVPVESREDREDAGLPGPGPLRVDANGFPAAEGADPAAGPASLLSAVDRLLAAGRSASARLRVRRFPDLALAALCGSGEDSPAMRFVAAAHEEQCGGGPAPAGAAGVPSLDVLRIRGVALLLEDRPAEAAEVLEDAAASAGDGRPWEAAHLQLLEAEARRRAASPYQATWSAAVERGARAAAPPRRALDPGFWERALRLRPEGTPWPESARAWMLAEAERSAAWRPAPGSEPPFDSVLRGVLGHLHLARNEGREALLSFSRAQEGDPPAGLRERLRLGQARALVQAGEADAGRALLGSLSSGGSAATAAEALSILGVLEIRAGRRDLGRRMLEEALGAGRLPDGPARHRAEANLALLLLASGSAEDGLRRLHAVEARWEAEGDLEELSVSLENEILHHERSGDGAEAERIRKRLRAVEAGPAR